MAQLARGRREQGCLSSPSGVGPQRVTDCQESDTAPSVCPLGSADHLFVGNGYICHFSISTGLQGAPGKGSGLGFQGLATLDECGPCQMALWVNVFEQPSGRSH